MTDPGSLDGFAVDLGGTKIAAARFAGGQMVERRRTTTDGGAPAHDLIGTMGALLLDLGHSPGAPLGIATAGLVDANGIWRAVNQDTLSDVRDVPLRALIRRKRRPAAVMNDAAAATLAEARFGGGRGLDNFAFLTVSTGAGGGLVLNGRLRQTPDGVAGNLGFMSSPNAAAPCGSGRHGTAESIASGRAVAQAAHQAGHDQLDARHSSTRPPPARPEQARSPRPRRAPSPTCAPICARPWDSEPYCSAAASAFPTDTWPGSTATLPACHRCFSARCASRKSARMGRFSGR